MQAAAVPCGDSTQACPVARCERHSGAPTPPKTCTTPTRTAVASLPLAGLLAASHAAALQKRVLHLLLQGIQRLARRHVCPQGPREGGARLMVQDREAAEGTESRKPGSRGCLEVLVWIGAGARRAAESCVRSEAPAAPRGQRLKQRAPHEVYFYLLACRKRPETRNDNHRLPPTPLSQTLCRTGRPLVKHSNAPALDPPRLLQAPQSKWRLIISWPLAEPADVVLHPRLGVRYPHDLHIVIFIRLRLRGSRWSCACIRQTPHCR